MHDALARQRTRKTFPGWTFLVWENRPAGNRNSDGPGTALPLAAAYQQLSFSA